ncbi:MyD88-dependent toll-like receptor signaling pathway [Desmophyllum pertusum]|uniref:MyD88-dependent toll-like receptor signaling pathway n=1 Tax=Desmophyllum pertusum TaxID=174260 RepID=A0A9W9YHC6_9CNID|nr:MyD88-dependent toll-like receptor signaling pathway [Desmophyllum pertusum]
MQDNLLSFGDLKIILKGLKRITKLDIKNNKIGPNLTKDVFAGFDNMEHIDLRRCHLENIENGTFHAMKNLSKLYLSWNMLSHITPETLEGPSDQLSFLILKGNYIRTVADGTFSRFTYLRRL